MSQPTTIGSPFLVGDLERAGPINPYTTPSMHSSGIPWLLMLSVQLPSSPFLGIFDLFLG